MFSYIKYFIKQSLSLILYILGTLTWLKFRFRKNSFLIILNYHNFSKYNNYKIKRGNILETAYAKNFEKQIRFLKKHFNFCYPEEFFSNRCKKGINILITFDDGYKDNYDIALPILKKYNAKAIFFVTTGFMGSEDWLWHDKVRYLISKGIICQKESERHLKQINSGEPLNNIFYNEVNNKFPNTAPKRMMLNWQEINRIKQHGFYLGIHTCHHVILGSLPEPEQENEIKNSIDELKEYTGYISKYIAYPNGSYNKITLQLLTKYNITFGFTTYKGVNNQNTPKKELKRIGINASDSIPFLLLKLFLIKIQ